MERSMKISIIGSFRKYYNEIKEIIKLFKKNNIHVLSPKDSEITHSVEDFVIFASDNSSLRPEEIQTETLNKILKSDIVYVYNPDGYVGRTTCYEIGVLRTTNIPLYFYQRPIDLPISVNSNYIMNPSKMIFQLVNNIKNNNDNNQLLIDKNKIRNELRAKNVVICGSMMFYDKMLEIAQFLNEQGVSTIIPKDENYEKEFLTESEFNEFKRKVSNQYLAKIRDSSTYSILVLNDEKKGISNYIGANTLVEIAMAFCWGRPIFLLNNYYPPLMDELLAWNVVCLNKNLMELVHRYKNTRYFTDDSSSGVDDNKQMELGDIDEHFYPLP